MSLTSQEYGALSDDVYKEPRETGLDSRPVHIGGITYKRLEYVDSPSGYQGIIYQRIDTNEIVVAHRGTETERELKQDGVYTDGGMVAARHNRQAAEAIELTKHALVYAQKLGKDGEALDVTVTGHSLGGNLAVKSLHLWHRLVRSPNLHSHRFPTSRFIRPSTANFPPAPRPPKPCMPRSRPSAQVS